MGLLQPKGFLQGKGNQEQNEKTTHQPEENIGSTLFDISLRRIFANTMSTRARETKEKINK